MSGTADSVAADARPIISVLIPTYNRPAQTLAAIDSVVSAAPHAVEIVVVDDGGDVAESWLPSHNVSGSTVVSVRSARNEGAGRARALGLGLSRGRYVAFLDSDDRFAPDWIDHCRQWIGALALPERAMLMGRLREETYLTAMALDLIGKAPEALRPVVARVVAMLFNPFHTTGLVMHRDLAAFHPRLRHCEDYFTVLSALFASDRVDIAPVQCATLGRLPGSPGGASAARGAMFRGELTVRLSALGAPAVPLRYRALVPVGMLYQLTRTTVKSVVGDALSRRGT